MSKIEVTNLRKKYNGQDDETLKGINLSIDEGEFLAIMGRSGSGKTTFLNILSTIDCIDSKSGDVLIDDISIQALSDSQAAIFRKEKIGFVFQDYMLIDSLTVKENIAISLSLVGVRGKEVDPIIEKYAKEFDLFNQLNKYPSDLSGGQRQRVSIIRAIIKQPTIIFADEPTGALDLKSSQVTMEVLSKINKIYNITIVMVTHDALSASYADRVVIMSDGEIEQSLKKTSRNEFIDQINQLLSEVGE